MSAPIDSVTPATALLDRGGTIKELRRHIPEKEEALRFFATYQAHKYLPPPPMACCNCGQPSSIMTHFSWRAIYSTQFAPSAVDLLLLLAGFIRIRTKSKVMGFETHHGFCGACWKGQWMKRGFANVVQFMGLLAGVISMVIASIGFGGFLYFRNDRSAAGDQSSLLWGGILGALVLVVSVFAVRFASMLRVPKALRCIARFPFRYLRIKKGAPMGGFPVMADRPV